MYTDYVFIFCDNILLAGVVGAKHLCSLILETADGATSIVNICIVHVHVCISYDLYVHLLLSLFVWYYYNCMTLCVFICGGMIDRHLL